MQSKNAPRGPGAAVILLQDQAHLGCLVRASSESESTTHDTGPPALCDETLDLWLVGHPPFYRCTDHPGSAQEMVGHWLSIELAAAGAVAKAL